MIQMNRMGIAQKYVGKGFLLIKLLHSLASLIKKVII